MADSSSALAMYSGFGFASMIIARGHALDEDREKILAEFSS